MKKKISIIILLMITLALFTSCTGGSYTMTMGNLKGNSNYIEGNYNSFNGKYFSKVKLNDGDTVEYQTSINTDAGSMKLVLLDEKKNVLVNLESTGLIEIIEDGSYYFMAIGDHHKGSFKAEWSIK
ncbi:Uncharacterised protein [uncultured Clostridium sp.]|nr:Uncharacterised protein [uncultured Clostridium sp.]